MNEDTKIYVHEYILHGRVSPASRSAKLLASYPRTRQTESLALRWENSQPLPPFMTIGAQGDVARPPQKTGHNSCN